MSKRLIKLSAAGSFMLLFLGGAVYLSNQSVEQREDQRVNEREYASIKATVKAQHPNVPQQGLPALQQEAFPEVQDEIKEAISINLQSYLNNSIYGELPNALKGIDIPKLYVDEHGNLIHDRHVMNVMEHFVAGARAEGADISLARTQEYFTMVLEEPARSQALILLDNYMEYRSRLNTVVNPQSMIENNEQLISSLKETLEKRRTLRRETLGQAAAEGLFGDHEKYEEYSVLMLETSKNPQLSEAEKNSLFAQHEELLPPRTKALVRHKREEMNLEMQIEALKQQGNKQSEVHALRSQFYGKPYADKMAYIEDHSDTWQARVENFNTVKENIQASPMFNDELKRKQINMFREQEFNEDEQLKLAWYHLQHN